jgi:hypothetical protein
MAKKSITPSAKDVASLQRDLQALVDAANRISKATSGKGGNALVKALTAVKTAAPAAPKAKRGPGRPPLKKSKAVAKKAAPKKKGGSGKRDGQRVGDLAGRVVEYITRSNRFVTNAQITDRLVSLYPNKDRSYLGKYMSVILSIMKGKKQLSSITKDRSGKKLRSSLWGLPQWFDGNTPKQEYLR